MIKVKIHLISLGLILLISQHGYTQEISQLKIACVGNSITYGTGTADRANDCYPAQLQHMLDAKYSGQCLVQNFSNPGRTMLKNGNLPLWNEIEYKNAIDFKPDIVIILLGTNDSKSINWDSYGSEYYTDYVSMINEFMTANPSATIFACLPPPVFQDLAGLSNNVVVNEIIPQIKNVTENTNARLIDFYHLFEGKEEYFPDYIHPNKEGLGMMAQTVFNTFEEINLINALNGNTPNTSTDYRHLKKGWNLIACTLTGNTDIEEAFSSIWDSFETIKTMDSFYEKNYPLQLNELKHLEYGQGYLIKVNNDCTVQW